MRELDDIDPETILVKPHYRASIRVSLIENKRLKDLQDQTVVSQDLKVTKKPSLVESL
jgi:hypothetical protein